MIRTFILSAAILAATATLANAKTVYYPREACAEIVSAEYSTGGGDKTFELYEILCKSKEGKYTTFVVSWGSAAGFLGWGRVFHETQIDLVPYDGTELKAN